MSIILFLDHTGAPVFWRTDLEVVAQQIFDPKPLKIMLVLESAEWASYYWTLGYPPWEVSNWIKKERELCNWVMPWCSSEGRS
jgi:hypothetical protein